MMTSLTFHEIQQSIDALLDRAASFDWSTMAEEERAEMQAAFEDAAEQLADLEAGKIDAYAFVIKTKQAMADFLKEEARKLQEKARAMESAVGRIQDRLLWIIHTKQGQPMKGDRYTISRRRSEAVMVSVQPEALPECYRRTKTTVEADKANLKAALKAGEAIDGVALVENFSVQIR